MKLDATPAQKLEGVVDFMRAGHDLLILELIGRLRMLTHPDDEQPPVLTSVGRGSTSCMAYRMKPNTAAAMVFDTAEDQHLEGAEQHYSGQTLVEWDGRTVVLDGRVHKDFGPPEAIEPEPVTVEPDPDEGLPL